MDYINDFETKMKYLKTTLTDEEIMILHYSIEEREKQILKYVIDYVNHIRHIFPLRKKEKTEKEHLNMIIKK